ncbi:hypothetical protein pEaSNUABM37_00293 [Erwinia phage pEa_SNUABM_37]|nr:hypothetical protein pEaSNUABM37_00293 [Erwinia phage pEa_SNUABM_37]QXO10761.1 hypothetical protein pEaSNUABM48_00293 [Erwinia phage pEa_SNUABM_48]
MSKHKRRKAAQRKQHNVTAKDRAREWQERLLKSRTQAEVERALRAAETKEVKISEPLPPTDPLSMLLDGVLDGGRVRSASQLLPGLYNPDGTLDLLKIATRFQSLGGVSFIDTEGSLFGHSETTRDKDGVWTTVCEPGMQMARKDIKVGNPNDKHTEQCMARHMARVNEAGEAQTKLLEAGEEALACYLLPVLMVCTCDQVDEPENEDDASRIQ